MWVFACFWVLATLWFAQIRTWCSRLTGLFLKHRRLLYVAWLGPCWGRIRYRKFSCIWCGIISSDLLLPGILSVLDRFFQYRFLLGLLSLGGQNLTEERTLLSRNLIYLTEILSVLGDFFWNSLLRCFLGLEWRGLTEDCALSIWNLIVRVEICMKSWTENLLLWLWNWLSLLNKRILALDNLLMTKSSPKRLTKSTRTHRAVTESIRGLIIHKTSSKTSQLSGVLWVLIEKTTWRNLISNWTFCLVLVLWITRCKVVITVTRLIFTALLTLNLLLSVLRNSLTKLWRVWLSLWRCLFLLLVLNWRLLLLTILSTLFCASLLAGVLTFLSLSKCLLAE